MPIPNLPPRDAITGRFIESIARDTARNTNTPPKVTKGMPNPLPPPPRQRIAQTPAAVPSTPPKGAKSFAPTPPPMGRNAPARPVPPKKGK